MKKLLILITLITGFGSLAQAEIAYDYKNPEHTIDKNCVGVVSFAKDLLYNDVQIVDGKVWLYTIEPNADVQNARLALADLSDALILKYEYSKQFNDHYRAWKTMVKIRVNEQGPDYLKEQLEICKNRI